MRVAIRQPVRALRKADRVADDLLVDIVSGELEVGEVLPKESELALRFGVNRSVIREAIKLLEVHRLVRPVRRRGTEVLDPVASLSPEVLRAMLVPRSGVIDVGMLENLLEIRTDFDVQMAGLAAARRTDADLSALDEAVGALGEARVDPRDYALAVNDLALAIARATQNRIFQMLVHWHVRVHRDLGDLMLVTRVASEPHLQGTQMLVSLIRTGDVDGARQLVEQFHRWATPRLLAAAALRAGATLEEALGEAGGAVRK
jgi:DNA-binding FadR family transcriptional regulator